MAQAFRRVLFFGVLPLLLLGGVVAWFERDALRTWYYLHRLEEAQGEEVSHWAARTATLEAAVVPSLLQMLAREDEGVCANAQAALSCLSERWGKTDPRSADILQQAVKVFPRFSLAGQVVILKLADDWAASDRACPEGLVCAGSRLLAGAHHLGQPALLGPSIELALTVVARSKRPELLCAASGVARASLVSPDPAVRARGLRLAVHPGIDLQSAAVKLLHDPHPLVRRAAMLAVGEDEKAIE